MTIIGSRATLVADFESDELEIIDVEPKKVDGRWTVSIRGSERPFVSTSAPADMISAELSDFLTCVEERRRASANVHTAGVVLARVMESYYKSAQEGKFISIP